MSFERFISNRYLRSKKRTGFISFTTFFSFIVIFLGVGCISIILSVMNGFESIVLDRFLALDSHVRIISKGENNITDHDGIGERLAGIPGVKAYSPYIQEKVMIQSSRYKKVVNLKGVDLRTIDNVSEFRQKIILGTTDFSGEGVTSRKRGIVVGKGVVDELAIVPGDELIIWSLRGLGRYFARPRVLRFIVTGIFESEISELDYMYAFVEIDAAQKLFQMGDAVTGIDVDSERIEDTDLIAPVIKDLYDEEYSVKTWYELHKNLFVSMKLEKWAALIVLSLMILVASFSIASALIMLVLEKRKEIGMLKSMGTSDKEIRKIFVISGMTIGGSGTVLGLIMGFTVCLLQQKYNIITLPTSTYIIDFLPVSIQALDFILVGVISIVLTLAATIYPSKSAAKLIPSKALKYE
ncbi:MAG: FtsX-like permease family protein [bacterium]|nr:FtsX-like permease family protein [bacterium]